MKSIRTISLQKDFSSRFQLKATLIMLAVGISLPFLFHLIPAFQGTPMGAILLPMFYAPFIAVILFRYHVAIITALLAPLANYLVTGHPHVELMTVLTFELAIFVSAAYLLNKYNQIRWITAPLSFLIAKVASAVLIALIPVLLVQASAVDFWINSVTTGLVGMVVLLLINFLVLKVKS
ncbi:MAG: hypothetical protein ACNS62_09165 [Candidatus Cyclobacteriaceae bacterium M3_2C_046]